MAPFLRPVRHVCVCVCVCVEYMLRAHGHAHLNPKAQSLKPEA